MCDVAACRLVDTLAPFAGMQHLDVAGGTGDVAFRVLRAIQTAEQLERQQPQQWQSQPQPQQAQQQPGQQQQQQQQLQPQQGAVTVFDINAEMLEVGKQRAKAQGEHSSSKVDAGTSVRST
jgi:2-methoxy-6-polyprenyl-1,4-benzoquinol methylase